MQSHPVVATVKHFIAYDQETNRVSGANSVVDERALLEIYLPAFAAAIQAGRAGAVMSSFNAINGTPACEHGELLTGILKDELGFQGWVMSDYGSTTSTVAAANAGFDQEMPGAAGDEGYGGGSVFFGGPLLEAVHAGQVSQARIDDMVRPHFAPMAALGLLDGERRRPAGGPVGDEVLADHAAQANAIAAEAITLLKNEGEVLPLSSGSVRSIAVIGGGRRPPGGDRRGVVCLHTRAYHHSVGRAAGGKPRARHRGALCTRRRPCGRHVDAAGPGCGAFVCAGAARRQAR